MQYRKLVGFGWTNQEVASKVGKSANYVSQMLTLAESNSDVQGMVARKEVAAHVALEVVKKHGSGAGKVLAGHLETARSAGKTKVTKKTVTPTEQPTPRPVYGDLLDTQRLDYLVDHRAVVVNGEKPMPDGPQAGSWLFWPTTVETQPGVFENPRAAIDAAMQSHAKAESQ